MFPLFEDDTPHGEIEESNVPASAIRSGLVPSTSAMIWHEEYRGFQVSYQSGDRVAWIKPRLSALALLDRTEVDRGEGRVELRAKAHMAIDAEIEAHSRDKPERMIFESVE